MVIKLMEMNLKTLPGYLMLLYPVIAIALAVFLCIPSAALAKYLYVIPTAEIPLRSGKGSEYRVVAVILNGSRVQLLEEDGDWAKVRTSNNKQGWMPKRYLNASPPLKDRVALLQVEKDQLKKQTTGISAQLDEASEARNQYEQELKICILDRDKIKKSYDSLKEDAADVLNFKKALSETAEELQEVKHKYTIAEQENEHLRDNSRIKWFLAGGGILIIGWIIGLITTRGRKRQPSLLR
ncbi:MAG: TIGR04211 family SH3 domain-containing protein [Thermodesulfobacteriota bacterium]|nr:TIGR04211 family SH3 domain-containing protein [Thermodesulfobacteriota bacterium]